MRAIHAKRMAKKYMNRNVVKYIHSFFFQPNRIPFPTWKTNPRLSPTCVETLNNPLRKSSRDPTGNGPNKGQNMTTWLIVGISPKRCRYIPNQIN